MSSYVESALTEGERVLYQGRLSWWTQFPLTALGVLLLPLFGAGLILIGIAWIRLRSTELAITNKRVITKLGLVSRDTLELNLQKIETVQVQQSVRGRLLNYGTLIIAGGGVTQEPIHGLADPMEFRRAFLEAQEESLK